MGGFTGLDLAILAVLVFGGWRGMRTGALYQLVGAAGLVVGILAGLALRGPVGALVVESLGLSERLAPALGFVVTFGVVVAAAAIVAQLARGALRFFKLGLVDRVAGAGVGGLRAALGVSVLLLVTGFALPGGEPILIGREARDASVLYQPVRTLAPAAWDALQGVLPRLRGEWPDAPSGETAATPSRAESRAD